MMTSALGHWRGQAVGREQGVGGDEILVEVVEGQGGLGDVEFVDGQFAGDHHGDFGEFDGEGEDVHAENFWAVTRLSSAGRVRRGWGIRCKALEDSDFEALEFAVGEVEEVAGAAGGVEHAEVGEAFEEVGELFEGFGGFDLLGPGFDDGGADDLHDVGRAW